MHPRHWFDALGLLASCELDWGYLLRRATGHEHRMLSLFLYARGEGLPVPGAILLALADRIMAPAAHDEHDVGRLQEVLAQDPRTNELGIDAVLSEGSVVLSGTVATPDRREAVLAVARKTLANDSCGRNHHRRGVRAPASRGPGLGASRRGGWGSG